MPRRPDQSYDPPVSATPPSASAGIFRGRLLIVSGSTGFTGAFFYSPNPGLGNLILSIATHSGVDPFGNAFNSDLTIYGSGGSKLWLNISNFSGLPGLSFYSGQSEEVDQGAIFEAINVPGATQSLSVDLVSPKNTHNSGAQISLISAAKDGSIPGNMQLNWFDSAGGAHLVQFFNQNGGSYFGAVQAIDPATSDTTLAGESLHALTGANSWTQSTGHPTFGVRVWAQNGEMELIGALVVPAGFVAGQIMNAAPGLPYRPLNAQTLFAMDLTNVNPIALVWDTNGHLIFQGPAANTAVGHVIQIANSNMDLIN